MPGMKSILKNVNVLNCLLSGAVVVLVYLMVLPLLNLDVRVTIPQVTPMATGSGIQTTALANPLPADYALVSDQNLFHPERKIPPEKKDDIVILKPDVILYGTLITDSMSVAFIEDRKAPKTTPGRGKRQIALHKGDSVSGYVLRQIDANSIILVKGDDRILIKLEEGEKRRDADAAKSPAAVGMFPAGSQPSMPAATPPAPAPAKRPAGPAASSSFRAVTTPPEAGVTVTPGSRPHSRQDISQEVQRLKQERQGQAQ
jgi:hypothetical protein